MGKLILMSVLLATVALPAIAARTPDARRGLGHLLWWALAFNVLYLLAVRFVYPRV